MVHDPQRVEFRIMCRCANGSELTCNITDTLADAIAYIRRIEPRLRDHYDLIVYEVKISNSAGIVYELKKTSH